MNEILSVGLILLAALVAGHIAQLVRIPEVTGYLLVGTLIGPAGLDVVSEHSVETLQFLSEIALGLILFSIGAIFEAESFRHVGARVATITAAEAGAAFVLVSLGMALFGLPIAVALLLGVIAMETAPATTLMVLHEYDAKGPLADTVLALLALNNMLVLVAFGLVTAGITFATAETTQGVLGLLYGSAYDLVWGIFGSIALGALLGIVLDAWSTRTRESGEVMILGIGVVLVGVGGARWLQLSPLFVTLALGATMVNASRRSDDFVEALKRADPPLYAAFFVLAGAELRPELLQTIGLVGAAYIVLRVAGKLGGTRWASRRTDLPPQVRRNVGLCMLSSSSLAIGLTIQVRSQFPSVAESITGVVLAAVIVFEILGPLAAKYALLNAGEVQTQPNLLDPLPDASASARLS